MGDINNDIAQLIEMLENSLDAKGKLDAISRLACVGTGEATAVLAKALETEEEPLVREALISALLLCNTEAVITEMVEVLRKGNACSRRAALEVLAYKCWDGIGQIIL